MAFSNVGDSPGTAFTNQSAATTVGVLDGGAAHSYHSMIVTAGAGVSAGVVNLELSNDNVNWFAPASNTTTTSAPGVTAVSVGPIPAQFLRARISTGITGGTVSAVLATA